MLARIANDQYIYLENVTTHEEGLVISRFSVGSYGHRFIDPRQRIWDGIYRKYNAQQKRLARPLLGELIQLSKDKSLPLVVRDDRPPPLYTAPPSETITPDYLPGITLAQDQIEAIRKLLLVECGVVSAVTGSGKTELMAAMCKAINCPTVIIAEVRVIIDQIKARLELRDVDEDFGIFYAGETPSGQRILIGSIQSLNSPKKVPDRPTREVGESEAVWQKRHSKYESMLKGIITRSKRAKMLQEMVRKSYMLLVDECDCATSKQYMNLFLHWFKGRRRYGFSGTPTDKDKPVEELVLQERLGSVVYHVDRSLVQERGRIVPIRYEMIAVGEDGDQKEGSAYDIAYNERVVHNVQFHQLVAALCRNYRNEGTLILVNRCDLGDALAGIIPDSEYIDGRTSQVKRRQALEDFEQRKLKVLIGGKIIHRGLDLHGGCENLILTTGGKQWSKFIQEVGRSLRVNQRGWARVIDFFFLNNRYLYAHSRSHLRAVVDMGYPSRVIYRHGQVEGQSLVATRFRKPKFATAVSKPQPEPSIF